MKSLKVLIINEYKVKGGTEQSVKKTKEILLRNGHDVHVMYLAENQGNLEKNEYGMGFRSSLFNKVFYNKKYFINVRKCIDSINPDLIVVNNVFSAPKAVFLALDGYCAYQVIRDYSAVCPKGTCIKDNGDVCAGINKERCWKSCTYQKSKLKLMGKMYLLAQNTKLRKKYIDKFIAPSKMLSKYANGIFDCVNIPNPILINSKSYIRNNTCKKHRYVYIGEIHDNKGIYELLEAFDIFSKNRDVELFIYGSIAHKEEDRFYELLKKNKKVKYYGYIVHEKIAEVLSESYTLIVPSKWMENYPTTVIEGMANKILVVGSNRGGIPEQLADNRGVVFDFGIKSLVDALIYVDNIDDRQYKEITERAFEYVYSNNSYEMYYSRLMNLIKTDNDKKYSD